MRADFLPKTDAVQAAAGKLFAVPGTGCVPAAGADGRVQEPRQAHGGEPGHRGVRRGVRTGVQQRTPRSESRRRCKGAQADAVGDRAAGARPHGSDARRTGARGRAGRRGDARAAASRARCSPTRASSRRSTAWRTLLASRYLVTYSRPGSADSANGVEVTSKRDRRAPGRLALGPVMRRRRGTLAGVVAVPVVGGRRRAGLSRRHGHRVAVGDGHRQRRPARAPASRTRRLPRLRRRRAAGNHALLRPA